MQAGHDPFAATESLVADQQVRTGNGLATGSPVSNRNLWTSRTPLAESLMNLAEDLAQRCRYLCLPARPFRLLRRVSRDGELLSTYSATTDPQYELPSPCSITAISRLDGRPSSSVTESSNCFYLSDNGDMTWLADLLAKIA
jgi:hypothetical protein